MGVADVTLSQAITQQLNQQELSIANLEEQVSSGRALNKPSDDPAAVTQVLQLSSQASQLSNWQANAQTATSWLGMGNDALNSVLDDMQSARTLILQTLNQGTQNSTTYQAAAQQLQGINADLLSTANTQYEGRPIFAGTSASSQAYDANGNYLGNTDTPNVVVGPGAGSGQTADLSVPGPSVFGAGAASVFNTLTTVVGQLASGRIELGSGISTGGPRLIVPCWSPGQSGSAPGVKGGQCREFWRRGQVGVVAGVNT